MKKVWIPIFLFALISCENGRGADPVVNKDEVRQEMKNLILSYGQAVGSMDVEKTISHFSDDPEFSVYSDGTHYTYAEIKASVRNEFFKGLKEVKIEWDTMNVQVLDAKNASCFAVLKQTLLDSADNTIKVRVEATFIGVKKENDWKIIYVQSRHELI